MITPLPLQAGQAPPPLKVNKDASRPLSSASSFLISSKKPKKVAGVERPVAVTGEIERYRFDREEKSFTLEFKQSEETKAKTEIFVPSVPKYAELDGEEIKIKRKGVVRFQTEPGEHEIKIFFK